MTKTTKLLHAFANGKVLSTKQIEKMGVANPSAHISYIRNVLGVQGVITSQKKGKTFYGYYSIAA